MIIETGGKHMNFKVGKFVNWDEYGDYIIVANLLEESLVKIKGSFNEEIKRILLTKECNNVDDELIKFLVNNKILVDSDLNEDELLEYKYYEAAYGNSELNLVIYPTVACNLRCKYCWENHENRFMSLGVRDSILRYLKREVRYYKRVYISWFGGEPLLDKKFLVDFMQDIKNICREEKTPLVSNITTNGYNLDIDTFTSLVRSNLLFYQITLDGTENIHNLYRPHVDVRCNSYQMIMNNLKAIKQSNLRHFHISIRVNISRELLGNIDDYLVVLHENFANDKRFSIIWHPIEDWGGIDDTGKEIVTDNMWDIIEDLNKKSYDLSLRPFIYKPKFEDVLCSACKNNAYIINVDGSVAKCVLCNDIAKSNKTIQHDNNIVGHLDLNGKLVLDKYKKAKWTVKTCLDEKCKSCSMLPICLKAVCPHVKKFSANQEECEINKDNYKLTLRELLEDAKEVELTL